MTIPPPFASAIQRPPRRATTDALEGFRAGSFIEVERVSHHGELFYLFSRM